MTARETLPPSVVVVQAWRDPLVERVGFPANSAYVELAWLPTLGPPATFTLRRLYQLVTAQPDGVQVDLRQLSSDLGMGSGTARNSLMARALRRLEQFGMARWRGDVLEVRAMVAPLPDRQAGRLSPDAAATHRQMLRIRQTDDGCPPRRSFGLSR